MSTPSQPGEEFDLQPHPRILPMLGEINLDQWRCLAELVDNSVDGFLQEVRAGRDVTTPEIHIAIPTQNNPTSRITVRDNGPGMGPDTLENAVRAGWTGNDPISSLGMFGMGFNIATARLGTATTVWTTREGDSEWYGLEIDFEKLLKQRHFRTPRKTRAKKDPLEHGTEITIDRLKPEQRAWFSRTANKSKLNKELGKVYSAMLSQNGAPISFRLTLNGEVIRGRYHCVWGGPNNPTRSVVTQRHGEIEAYQVVNRQLGERPFCMGCWTWLSYDETVCSACGSSNVVKRQRRVTGWLGLQRYLSDTDYGIDLLRNGRKIEVANKELFTWSDGADREYPIDDPRNRGRIVGEIHLDHCRLSYMKDRFDRNDPAWEEMIREIRGEGPLRPDKAADLGYGENRSPLYLLFQAFRRSNPKPKVAGSYAKLLVIPDNDRAETMARQFYAGEPNFQSDAKWWELVEEADRELLIAPGGGDPGGAAPPGPGLFGGGGNGGAPGPSGQPGTPPAQPGTAGPPPPPPPIRTAIPSLSREYREDATSLRWDVRAYQVGTRDPELGTPNRAWRLRRTNAGPSEFYINTDHPVFRSATMTPLDALLSEIAHEAADFQRGSQNPMSFAEILFNLRERYATISRLDTTSLSNDAVLTLSTIAQSLTRNIDAEDSRALFNELSPSEQQAIWGKMAARAVGNPRQVVDDGRFLEFAQTKTILRFVERHPELFFDGRYWDDVYSGSDYSVPAATEEAQLQVVRYYMSLLSDAAWLAEQDPSELRSATRSRLLRAALALDLLAPSSPPENDQ